MQLKELARIIGGTFNNSPENTEVNHISIDSRTILGLPNEVFFAISGQQHNAHDFIPELIEKGIKFFVVEEDLRAEKTATFFKVNSTLDALQQLAQFKRQQFNGNVIGITGSNGKTIVKEWLSTLLSTGSKVLKSPKSYNSQLGVPLSVWPIDNSYQVGIFEAGISQPNEMEKLGQIIQPTIGIFTNIGSAHGEHFESQTQKIQEKLKLFRNTELLIYCRDHQLVDEQVEATYCCNSLNWGINADSDIPVRITGKKLQVGFLGKDYTFELPFTDAASVENLCHCIVASLHIGLSQGQISDGIRKLKSVKMRLSLKRGLRNNYLIDDSYNNDFEGLKLALDFMEQQNLKEDRMVILTDFVQTKADAQFYQQVNELLKLKKVAQLYAIGPALSAAKSQFGASATFYEDTRAFLKSDVLEELEDKLILVKGSRKFGLERVMHRLVEKIHKTVLEVSLESIAHNLKVFRGFLKPETKVMAMVKAFAYGAGSIEIARLLEFHGVDYLAVAYTDEAITLRNNGIDLPMMVMNATLDDPATLMKYQLEPEIYSINQLKAYVKKYKRAQQKLPAHLIVNTGMNRLGINPSELGALKEVIAQTEWLEIKSIFTHLAASDDLGERDFTLKQIENFNQFSAELSAHLDHEPMKHVLNSAGIVHYPEHQYNMVRLGIGLHGLEADGIRKGSLRLPAQLKTLVSQIRTVKQGETIGYGRKGKAEKEMRIATIAIGYADGYLRIFGNGNAYVSINGQQARTIGNVCMDMTMVDVTGLNVTEGDEVIVFGEQPTINDLAKWANTIPYEILTNVSTRVQRIFHTD
ncbi:bifunctional UDP-N-acetylmuramoyl-tripeptide:D-alanyl-D-alanine ligase/alanine racemase [Roseivirga pacifica]|uniref:bifunctional UDP-N-acetylmuramoyl-tripeptide:D-alanyl-D-alanine ligase/alanine racemase n=1 Tax=Roseivirga pacifica TaxID=1267423 RepID=UPI002094F0C1|nr:bifunctional UDP-N-acetylmuramoyl-tripeptide:D-alanyl-D-alanine ligase/alanine racemase [Roseivirga pacifica]